MTANMERGRHIGSRESERDIKRNQVDRKMVRKLGQLHSGSLR